MTNLPEYDVAERFLNLADEDSFDALFRLFSPQLIAFFRNRGHDRGDAEDLAQDVMLIVYLRAGEIRDHRLFRAWLFKVARNAACRHIVQRMRQIPTVNVPEMSKFVAAPSKAGSEFEDWMKVLKPHEREAMTLRFVEDWEYHEIAAAKAIPIGTVQWRVFNSKKKLAAHLNLRNDLARAA